MKCTAVLIFIFTFLFLQYSYAQESPEIRMSTAVKSTVESTTQFIVGNSCPTCSISINDSAVKVYPTGTFAWPVHLIEGENIFTIISKNTQGKTSSKTVQFIYKKKEPEKPVTTTSIESIETFPEGDRVLRPGDKIQFRVKALPRSKLSVLGTDLYELPISASGGLPGIYQGEYSVKESDHFSSERLPVKMITDSGVTLQKSTAAKFSILSELASDILMTKGDLAHIDYGYGKDRLGGAKIGYLVEGIPMRIVGKLGKNFKVQLSKNNYAYISEDNVSLMPKGSLLQTSLSGSWSVYGDGRYDYVRIGLENKHPYISRQIIQPTKIEVDIFGVISNTNWITQLESAEEVVSVDYQQIEEDIFRVTILLKNKQHWGHSIYYEGNSLLIKIKQQPKQLLLQNMTIAVDAGHGGSNRGARGPAGFLEKDLALDIALKLQKQLESAGAKVIMTRSTEKSVANNDRIRNYRQAEPDLLVSIHLNSSSHPFRGKGTGSFYKHAGFRDLSRFIHLRMMELGLKEYGNVGAFNFMLNSPTEYPNALVETLFISNPEEEALIVQPEFRQQIAEKIALGIQDFLKASTP